MIDEQLYQFATEELNSARRVSELWNRACALACDDHDEARYLYINIRVEELLEQHAKGEPLPFISSSAASSALDIDADTSPDNNLDNNRGTIPANNADTSAELQLSLEQDNSLEIDAGLQMDTDLGDVSASSAVSSTNRAFASNFDATDSPVPESVTGAVPELEPDVVQKTAPEVPEYVQDDSTSGAVSSTNRDFGSNFDTSESPVDEPVTDVIPNTAPEVPEPKAPKYEQPDTSSSFRATTSTLEPGEAAPEFDLDAAKAMNQESDEALSSKLLAQSADTPGLGALPSLDPEISSLAASATKSMKEAPGIGSESKMDETLDMDATLETPINHGVLDSDVQALIDKYSTPDDGTAAPDQSTADRPVLDQTIDIADQVGSADPSPSTDDLAFLDSTTTSSESEPHVHVPSAIDNEVDDPLKADLERQANTWLPSGDETHTQSSHQPSPVTRDYAAPGAGAAAAATAALTHISSRELGANDTDLNNDTIAVEEELEQAELLSGKGRLYRIFSRGPTDTRAVNRGMSWTAMLFTLPWLLVKRMPGTAIVYTLLWIVLIAGLLVTGIHWLDSSTKAPTSTLLSPALWQEQWPAILPHLWPLAFAVLAVLGLILLPLLMANRWHASSLIGRGYDEIAMVRAKTKNGAIERVIPTAS